MAIGAEATRRLGQAPLAHGEGVAHARRRAAALPLVLAVAALGLAAAAAVLPAVPKRATYLWPPTALSGNPVRSWFAPLLAERGTADAVSAVIPCRPGRVLADAGANPVVFATARAARSFDALQAQWLGKEQLLVVRAGATTLARIRAPSTIACTDTIRVDGRRWSIRQSTGSRASGTLSREVGLTGLLTQLDLRAKPTLRVEATPTTEDTRSSTTQTILRILGLVGLLGALVLVVRRDSRPHPRLLSGAFPRPGLPDAFVGLVLVTWWIVGPVYFDDGWVTARQTNSLLSGGFSNYFNEHGANLPVGWWLEWLQRLVVGHTATLFWQRVPAIVCLAALWIVARATLVALVGRPAKRGNAAWWSAAAVFGVGAAAFGITLRPEPMNALLTAGVLLCTVSFARRPSLAPLVLAAVLAGLAVTEHPEGLLSLAPVIACLPRIVRAVRSRVIEGWSIAAVGIAFAAWATLLEFLGSDLRHRLTDRRLVGVGSHAYGVTDEWRRYAWFPSAASPLQREFILLCILCVFAFLLRRRRSLRPGDLLPVGSLPVGLALLAFVPSKWIWHFGPLIGICVVAVGVEVADWRKRSPRHDSSLRAGLAAAVLFLASGWSALSPAGWGPLDLRSLTAGHVSFPLLVPLVGLRLLLGLGGLAILVWTTTAFVRGDRRADGHAWKSLSLGLPVVLVTLLALSTAVFVADALATPGSTPPRQSIDALLGRPSCALADDTSVPDVRTMVAARPMGAVAISAAAASSAPAAGLQVVRSGAAVSSSSGWFEVPPQGRALGLYVGGVWKRSDSLMLTWGRLTGGRIAPMAAGRVRLQEILSRGSDRAAWRLVPQSRLPARPNGASAVRVRIDGAAGRGARATSPLWYSSMRLAELMQRPSTVAIVSPFALEYIPCARLPAVRWGVAEWPSLVVDLNGDATADGPTSPFAGVPDLFSVTRLPLEARLRLPSHVTAYSVSVGRDDAIAPAVRERTS